MKKLLYLFLAITFACSSGDENNRVKDTYICSEYVDLTKYCRDSSKGYPYYTVEYKGFIVGEGVKDSDLEFVGLDKVYFKGKPYSGKSVNKDQQRTYKDGMLTHIKSFEGDYNSYSGWKYKGKEWFYDDKCLIKIIEYGYGFTYDHPYRMMELDKVTYYKKLPLGEKEIIDSIEYYYSVNKTLFTTERK